MTPYIVYRQWPPETEWRQHDFHKDRATAIRQAKNLRRSGKCATRVIELQTIETIIYEGERPAPHRAIQKLKKLTEPEIQKLVKGVLAHAREKYEEFIRKDDAKLARIARQTGRLK